MHGVLRYGDHCASVQWRSGDFSLGLATERFDNCIMTKYELVKIRLYESLVLSVLHTVPKRGL